MAHYNKKIRRGFVVSNKMNKTGVILVRRTIQHPLYKRTVKASKKYKFHDPQDVCQIGDEVSIIECRAYSKDKHWKLYRIIKKAI